MLVFLKVLTDFTSIPAAVVVGYCVTDYAFWSERVVKFGNFDLLPLGLYNKVPAFAFLAKATEFYKLIVVAEGLLGVVMLVVFLGKVVATLVYCFLIVIVFDRNGVLGFLFC